MSDSTNYRKDVLGNLDEKAGSAAPLIPAATVVLLRSQGETVEVLMLQRNKGISFGGMWVFPGGKIEANDYTADNNLEQAARKAAVRETEEETGLVLDEDSFVCFSHWTPPPSSPKRFSTWFYIAETDFKDQITVDGSEILDHRWISPAEALALQADGKIELAPPTWITLYQLSQRSVISEMIAHYEENGLLHYATRLEVNAEGNPLAIWFGDAAYESGDVDMSGDRHRLIMKKGGFVFENTVVD